MEFSCEFGHFKAIGSKSFSDILKLAGALSCNLLVAPFFLESFVWLFFFVNFFMLLNQSDFLS